MHKSVIEFISLEINWGSTGKQKSVGGSIPDGSRKKIFSYAYFVTCYFFSRLRRKKINVIRGHDQGQLYTNLKVPGIMTRPGIEPGLPTWDASTLEQSYLDSLFVDYSELLLALRLAL